MQARERVLKFIASTMLNFYLRFLLCIFLASFYLEICPVGACTVCKKHHFIANRVISGASFWWGMFQIMGLQNQTDFATTMDKIFEKNSSFYVR